MRRRVHQFVRGLAQKLLGLKGSVSDWAPGRGDDLYCASQDEAMTQAAWYAGVTLLAETVASLPLNLFQLDSEAMKRKVPRLHHIYELLAVRPNRYQTSFEFRERLMVHLLTWNVAYIEIVRHGGRIMELNALHPRYMSIINIEGETRYLYQPDYDARVGARELSGDQISVIEGRYFGDDAFVNRTTIVDMAGTTVGLSRAQEQYAIDYFANGTTVSGYLGTDGRLSDEARETLGDSWNNRHSGPRKPHGTAVLEQGVKYHPMNHTNKDSQVVEGRIHQLGEVCRWLRIPPPMLYDLSKATYSNIEAMNLGFEKHSIRPWLERLEAWFNAFLLPSGMVAEHDSAALLRGDFKTRIEGLGKATGRPWMTPNEARVSEGLDRVPDLDNVGQPFNMNNSGGN